MKRSATKTSNIVTLYADYDNLIDDVYTFKGISDVII